MITNRLHKLQIASLDESKEILEQYSLNQLEALYCECVEFKDQLQVAYMRLLNEINNRNEERHTK